MESNRSSQTVPQALLMHTSKRPALVVAVSVTFMRRISPVEQSPAAVLETRERERTGDSMRRNEGGKAHLDR